MVDDAHLDLLRGTIPKQPTYMVRNAKGRLAMQWNFWSLYKSLTEHGLNRQRNETHRGRPTR